MNHSTLPSWPRWIETRNGEVTVSGRHRTSRTNKIASEIAGFIGLLVLINGFCFSYSIVNRVIVVLARLYNPSWTTDSIFACIFFGSFFGTLVVMAVLTPLIALLVRHKTTIRFSARTVAVPRRIFPGWRRIGRSAAGELEFFARDREHVHAYRHEDKRGNVTSGVTAFDVFTVYMRCGWGSEMKLGEFIDEEKAASFMAMCRAAAAATQATSTRQSLPTVRVVQPVPQIGAYRTAPQLGGPREHVSVRRRLN